MRCGARPAQRRRAGSAHTNTHPQLTTPNWKFVNVVLSRDSRAIEMRKQYVSHSVVSILLFFNRARSLCFSFDRECAAIHGMDCILIEYEVASHGLQCNSLSFWAAAAAEVNYQLLECCRAVATRNCVNSKMGNVWNTFREAYALFWQPQPQSFLEIWWKMWHEFSKSDECCRTAVVA